MKNESKFWRNNYFIMVGLCLAMIVLYSLETNDFLSFQLYEDNDDMLILANDLILQEKYPSPALLQEAIDNGEYDYTQLSPAMKGMMDFYNEDIGK